MKKPPKSMTKTLLISSISEISGLSKNVSHHVLNSVMQVITDSLKDGKDVKIHRFGVFKTHMRLETKGRNPRTGKPHTIPAKKIPKFRPSLSLRAEIS